MSPPARRYKLVAPVVPEHATQKAIADVLRVELGPPGKVSRAGVVWWSVDHANYAGEVPGIRVGRGIVAGLPDMLFLYRGRAYLIELKTHDGILSEAQRSVLAAALAASCSVGVARSVEEILGLLDAWGLPRNGRVRI